MTRLWTKLTIQKLRLSRRIKLWKKELVVIVGSLRWGRPTFFNLDLHIGVIPDLEKEILAQGGDLVRWSLSAHNHLVDGLSDSPHPVRHVNANTWKDLGETDIGQKFSRRYAKFISSFSGFIVTYSPTFAELFKDSVAPILIMAATRYETPFTSNRNRWAKFNEFLSQQVATDRLILCANNQGDADYIHYFTGLVPRVVPSVCEKEGLRWTGGSERRVIIGRVPGLVERIQHESGGRFEAVSVLGEPYAWEDLLDCAEVLVLPQNISTMSLFELATAGVPVVIPDKKWMVELVRSYPGLLSELSFAALEKISCVGLAEDDPTNWQSEKYLDWWLDRADFYDAQLMPNVRLASNLEELLKGASAPVLKGAQYWPIIEQRNSGIREGRTLLIRDFIALATT